MRVFGWRRFAVAVVEVIAVMWWVGLFAAVLRLSGGRLLRVACRVQQGMHQAVDLLAQRPDAAVVGTARGRFDRVGVRLGLALAHAGRPSRTTRTMTRRGRELRRLRWESARR